MTQWTAEKIAAYRIVRAWECGSKSLWRIRNAVESFERFLEDRSSWKQLNLTDLQQSALTASLQRPVEQDLETMDREAIRFLLPEDELFPPIFKQIPDPPAALFMRGVMIPDELRIAMVGTRKMTAYGSRCAEFLSRELAMHGVTVVSGLAIGIDAACHKASLDAGGRTVAVLPSGVNDRSIVPGVHGRLAQSIIEHGGLLLSENAPNTPTLPYQYLHRNRLISGCADATVVVEADRDSGAITTAKCALEQGREVLAVPGSIWSAASRGTNDLIMNGARPCTSMNDMMSAINLDHAHDASHVSAVRSSIPHTPDEARVLELLNEPRAADELVRLCAMPTAQMSAILSVLEMKGHIMFVGPRMVARTS